MSWREISGQQNLELARALLDKQGEVNDLKEQLLHARTKVAKVREIVTEHAKCRNGCDALLEIEDAIDDH
jgi:hypothetical protein